jgi:hypothetical protein
MVTLLVSYLAVKTASLAGTWKYQAFDASKHLVATGEISLKSDPALGAGHYAGSKTIKQMRDESLIGAHANTLRTTTSISALVIGTAVYIDLNSGMKDDNVNLKGTLKGKSISGTWAFLTVTGPRSRGTFTLTRGK